MIIKTVQLGQDSKDRKAWTCQPGPCPERTGCPKLDRKDRTAQTGQLGQDSHKRTAVTGQSVQVCTYRSACWSIYMITQNVKERLSPGQIITPNV
jgi:hypothetical protein